MKIQHQERRVYLYLIVLVITLILITLLISRRQMQQLEKTKPRLGLVIRPMQLPLYLSTSIDPIKTN